MGRKTMIKTIVSTLCSISIIISSIFIGSNSKAAANSTLYISPASSPSISVGSDFHLDVYINPGTNQATGAELHLTYPQLSQNTLRLDSIDTTGSAFPNVLQAANINNASGTASIVIAVNATTPVVPVTTTSKIATLNFHALGTVTNAQIAFDASQTYATALGEGGDVLTARTPATVTVTSQAGDNTPPVRSNGSPSGEIAAGTINTTLTVSTDENATCKYSSTQGISFASMSNTFTTTGGMSHAVTLSSLSNGTDYNFYVRCKDGSNNANVDDYKISFSIASQSSQIVATDNNDSGSSHKDDGGKKKAKPEKRKITSKNTVKRFTILVQSGKRFSKNSPVLLYFSKLGGGFYAPTKVITNSKGSFSLVYFVTKPAGTYTWYAVDTKTGRRSKNQHYRIR